MIWLKGADSLPKYEDAIRDLEFLLADKPEKVKAENYDAWFAWTSGIGCGAFTENEISKEIGLSKSELNLASFVKIMENQLENSRIGRN